MENQHNLQKVFRFSECNDPIEFGGRHGEHCLASFQVYTWSVAEKKCVLGIYGGCFGSKNRFETLAECEKLAAPICKDL